MSTPRRIQVECGEPRHKLKETRKQQYQWNQQTINSQLQKFFFSLYILLITFLPINGQTSRYDNPDKSDGCDTQCIITWCGVSIGVIALIIVAYYLRQRLYRFRVSNVVVLGKYKKCIQS